MIQTVNADVQSSLHKCNSSMLIWCVFLDKSDLIKSGYTVLIVIMAETFRFIS
jgi:hypothetical protein